ncbi:Caudovirales tail fiber assembly protein [Caballeronia temeraria]|uniref:Caudovirales tail fiber assembly protein n=1 Tax=Caballeronia temeraria TaxID=1777137 RepID=A0A158D1M2_9BURK|nr:tail fiber assembly protein [Caballeronia temeraria]SAK88393.1 Caudovirales tail fiber assembly protein [Caballeronia temeraria]
MGQKQAAYDASGALIAFYDTEDSPAPVGADVVDISNDLWLSLLEAQSQGKRLIRGEDGAPVTADPLPPDAGQVLTINSARRDSLLATAALAIAPLQDAVDLDDATDEEAALLKQWKQYRVAVNRVDLTQWPVQWPALPGA